VNVTDLRVISDAGDAVITLPVSPDEDALLRRLAQFERLGATLAPTMTLLKDEIRARDRRDTIREPGEKWVSA
jgi:cytidylate kinase